jgi:hypothetical protein
MDSNSASSNTESSNKLLLGGKNPLIDQNMTGKEWRLMTSQLRQDPSIRSVKLSRTDLVDDERLELLLDS